MSTFLYHGSAKIIEGPLRPVLLQDSADRVHVKPVVFGTERIDVASLFMFPMKPVSSIGFENDIAYICIWGTLEEFRAYNEEGYIYVLPKDTFEKIGKEYEWQSFQEVNPVEIKNFTSVVDGAMECGAQVYFVNEEGVFDRIVEDKNNRATILKDLVSENQKRGINVKPF